MSDTQWRRVDEIEGYKQKTFNLSRTDRIGRVITKTFELMQTIIRDGPNAETLIYDVESLKTEQANSLKWDANQSDLFRSILYDLSTSLGSMIESIQEQNVTETENYEFLSSITADAIKIEPVEFQQDNLITKLDMKPFRISDTVSQNSAEDVAVIDKTEVIMNRGSETNNSDVSAIVNNENGERDSGTAKGAPIIRQSSRKRPRSVIVPKVNYEEEEEEQNTDEVAPSAITNLREGNINCNHCERWFNSLLALKRHMMIHEGTRCGDCGKRLKTRGNLQRHYTEFHPGKPMKAANDSSVAFASLKCTQCAHTASDYSNLAIHLRKHSGEKPFSCRICATKFADNPALYTHLRRTHGEKPFECEDCGMKFGRFAEKFHHKKTMHRT